MIKKYICGSFCGSIWKIFSQVICTYKKENIQLFNGIMLGTYSYTVLFCMKCKQVSSDINLNVLKISHISM